MNQAGIWHLTRLIQVLTDDPDNPYDIKSSLNFAGFPL